MAREDVMLIDRAFDGSEIWDEEEDIEEDPLFDEDDLDEDGDRITFEGEYVSNPDPAADVDTPDVEEYSGDDELDAGDYDPEDAHEPEGDFDDVGD